MPNRNVTGLACGGSSNSNWFEPASGPNSGNRLQRRRATSFVPNGSVATTPPASYNSQPFIYMTREDDRYNAAFMAHEEINDSFQPYAEFFFMDDKTHQQVAPAALFKDSQSARSDRRGRLLHQLQQSLVERAGAGNPLHAGADRGRYCEPGSATAQVRIGRRNIEGGDRFTDFEHTNYRAVFGTKGDFADAWSYDALWAVLLHRIFRLQSEVLELSRASPMRCW